MRLWRRRARLMGIAYVDDYANLWLESDPAAGLSALELEALCSEQIAWGEACLRGLSPDDRAVLSLDSCCPASNSQRIASLLKHGFLLQELRTLRYSRPLSQPSQGLPLPNSQGYLPHLPPPGFTIRPTFGLSELDDLVRLHCSAFGTDQMTADQCLGIMSAPGYLPELDLVAVSPSGELAGFCICGLRQDDPAVSYTDPLGVDPRFRRLGLGKALLSKGFRLLKMRRASAVELGTTSANLPMQRLAEVMGFVLVSEKCWFSKSLPHLAENPSNSAGFYP